MSGRYKKHLKAGFTACLFLFPFLGYGHGQWTFSDPAHRAYQKIFALDFEGAYALVPKPNTPDEVYTIALAQSVELLLSEDARLFDAYQEQIAQWRDRKTNTPHELFLHAELALQMAFVYFKFGHEFDAALSLRDAYTTSTHLRKRYPAFEAGMKTAAFLEIIVGAVPEKYHWVLSLLGIEGSIDTGLALFGKLHTSNSPLQMESTLLYALARCYILQQTHESLALLEDIPEGDQPLVMFLTASVAMKDAQSARALALLQKVTTLENFELDYASYLLGEVYLHMGDYVPAIAAYRRFLHHYKGLNNVKDAAFKTGLCYWLNGNTNDARSMFDQARDLGREITEADKYAARALAEKELPHRKLTQARYAPDGGLYERARQVLDSIDKDELITPRDELEFYYRRARLEHKTGNLEAARRDYETTIQRNGQANWYFAPNACLQLGYISMETGDTKRARQYFEQALSYKRHEYKNSIDTKARSALAQLKRK